MSVTLTRPPVRLSIGLLLVLVALLQPLAVSLAAPSQLEQAGDGVLIINRFETDQPLIALTFDAGSDVGYTDDILDLLAREGIKATFGMTGAWAQQYPELIQRMHAEGHQLINHSWSHPSFPQLSREERISEIERTDALLIELTGETTRPYFRPPYGEYDAATLDDLAALGYTTMVMWTVDTLGWAGLDAAGINQRVFETAVPGGIVLMHVGGQSQDAAALPGMIAGLRARGYDFATVHDLAQGTAVVEQHFAETGQWVRGKFLQFWRAYGGLDVFGYPLTGELEEDGLTVQYFERARFELHPDAWPERFDVLLTRLAADMVADRIARGEEPFRPIRAESDDFCNFYPETGHRLCGAFREYWESRGGLAIYGFPLSEEFDERNPDTGEVYTVQYFERARFEWHPENVGTDYEVLLGRLGAQALAER